MRRVVFCGPHFPAACQFTQALLAEKSEDYSVVQSSDCDLLELIRSAHVLIPFMTKITKELIDEAQELKLIVQFGVGIEGVDVPAATEKGVLVARIPSHDNGNAQSCAEHALLLALALLRDMPGMQRALCEERLGYPLGRTIYQSRALVYGYGGIGRALVPRLRALGAHVSVVRRSVDDLDRAQRSSELLFMDGAEFRSRQHEADLVFLCTDQNPETVELVDKHFLALLSRGAILINVARGGLLQYDDVLDALETEHLRALGLDVFQAEPAPVLGNPFFAHPRVLLTPHVAGVTEVSYARMAQQLAELVDDLLVRGAAPPGTVNLQALAERFAQSLAF